jgi:hypothetical protein
MSEESFESGNGDEELSGSSIGELLPFLSIWFNDKRRTVCINVLSAPSDDVVGGGDDDLALGNKGALIKGVRVALGALFGENFVVTTERKKKKNCINYLIRTSYWYLVLLSKDKRK